MKPDVFWSLFAMPIGLLICFGPALLVYALVGPREPRSGTSSTSTGEKAR